MVNVLSAFISLRFEEPDNKPRPRPSQVSVPDLFWEKDDSEHLGTPVWEWPPYRDSYSTASIHRSASFKPDFHRYNVVPAQALMEVCLAEESDIQYKIFGARTKQFKAIREILIAGDTNRLVAELTFVRINDLAAPPEPIHPLLLIEPFVALLIVANGIMIGFQTDRRFKDWTGWVYMETIFAVFLVLEIALRVHLLKCRPFWCGPERWWNFFDLFLSVTGCTDVVIQIIRQDNSDVFRTSLLRFCRLIRLVRIVKVFRLKFMRDLRLMVKGLIAGIKTLILAFTLLFSVLYVISGFATMILGNDVRTEELQLGDYFQSLPDSMFTAFRCFTGECVNEQGHSITSMLAKEFGLTFMFSYVCSYMLVAMGIFNVILAVYVDITMKAAKDNDTNAEQYARESVRIAQCARELVKIFAAAFRRFNETDETHGKRTSMGFDAVPAAFTDNDVHDEIQITKELFLIMIQDRGVQKLMNELDLPPDRANLFEVIDADGNGTLHIAELVHGMLKIRGDVTKSDTVATLLATKSLQQLTTRMKAEWRIDFDNLLYRIGSLQDEVQELRLIRQGPGPAPDVAGPEPELHDQPVCFRPVFPTSLLTVPVPAKPTDVQEESDDSELGFLPPSLSR